MCSAGGALMGLQLFGTSMSAGAAYGKAESDKIALQGQADIAEINARLSETSAQTSLLTGQREEQKSRIATANLKGTQRARLAANGVDLGVGSANDVLTTTDYMGEIDAQTIQENALRSAWGYRTQAVSQKAQARSSRGASDAVNPNSAMVSTLIGGAGQVASSWYQMSNRGSGPATTDPRAPARG